MPAILRIFLYQTDASLSVIGSTPSYDQGADLSGADQICEHYEVSALWVYLRYRFRMYWA